MRRRTPGGPRRLSSLRGVRPGVARDTRVRRWRASWRNDDVPDQTDESLASFDPAHSQTCGAGSTGALVVPAALGRRVLDHRHLGLPAGAPPRGAAARAHASQTYARPAAAGFVVASACAGSGPPRARGIGGPSAGRPVAGVAAGRDAGGDRPSRRGTPPHRVPSAQRLPALDAGRTAREASRFRGLKGPPRPRPMLDDRRPLNRTRSTRGTPPRDHARRACRKAARASRSRWCAGLRRSPSHSGRPAASRECD
jgi:hypothetical protein